MSARIFVGLEIKNGTEKKCGIRNQVCKFVEKDIVYDDFVQGGRTARG